MPVPVLLLFGTALLVFYMLYGINLPAKHLILLVVILILGGFAVAQVGAGYRCLRNPKKYLQELEYEKTPIDCRKFPNRDECIMDAFLNRRPD